MSTTTPANNIKRVKRPTESIPEECVFESKTEPGQLYLRKSEVGTALDCSIKTGSEPWKHDLRFEDFVGLYRGKYYGYGVTISYNDGLFVEVDVPMYEVTPVETTIEEWGPVTSESKGIL